jgi:catechol 2,3-dioxygenase-like lactoylglutathione lyase family enzyme
MENLSLSSVALRVHNMEAMVGFYTQAFQIEFRVVDTFGLQSQFGELNRITLKFVPIRDSANFEEYPIHQLGFNVRDVQATIDLALQFGGKREGDILRDGDKVYAAVRDPDGNTLELYGA